MGQGSYVICEWDSVFREYPEFQSAFRNLEAQIVEKCRMDWHPTKTLEQCYGRLTSKAGQFGRTTILPALFDDHSAVQMAHWRQHFTVAGHQTLMTGTRAGNTIPEDFKIAWMGLMLPNKNQHLTEIKYQIGDTKFGRLNLEEIHSYNKPAIIFEEGYLIDEEVSFDLYGYIQGPIPDQLPFIQGVYQRIVPLGACYWKVIDRVLGNCGAAI